MYMQSFTTKIVNMMKSEKLYASQGGPIILSQIENEYQTVEKAFGEKGASYVKWAAQMVLGLQTGVPWIMCKQEDAPDPVINACNGLKCGMKFVPNSPNKPSIWAENWTSQYQVYGEVARSRSPEDIAFQVALFVAKNGSFVNYYMYHGGTNFGRAASAYVTTSYYDEAPLDEYGMKRQPKWGHLMELHAAIKQCSNALLGGAQAILPLGQQQTAYVFREKSGECAAFLVNIDEIRSVSVSFQNSFYNLPRKSISILPNCKDVSFNTAKVNTPYSTRAMVPAKKLNAAQMWVEIREVIPNYEDTSTRSKMLLEQMSTTKDVSDYLWYTFRFRHQFGNSTAILNVYSLGHVLHAFVNGVHVGSAHGSHRSRDFTLETAITLKNGINRVALLSAMVGLPDSGAFMERKAAGIRRVRVHDSRNVKDFTNHAWGYQVGLLGERLQVYSYRGSGQVQWTRFSSSYEPLTWYKTVFDAPRGDKPVALDLGSMGKGEAWINGESIGRYWVSFHTSDGSPSQRWYNVPRSFLRPTGNLLVILEEEGGSPLGISLDIVSTGYV